MRCAIAIAIENYEEFFEKYGLRYCLEKAAQYLKNDEIHVLVAAGHELIPQDVLAFLKERRINIVDASTTYQAILQKNPYLEKVSDLRLYLRICFIRHLLLEEYFGGEGVLSFDADVVWRADPYELASYWQGGSFVFDGSPCLTVANDSRWFQQYRSGLEQWCVDPSFGLDFDDPGLQRSGVQHDQDLIQYLFGTGRLDNDMRRARAHPITEGMAMFANPLAPELGVPLAERDIGTLKFSREGASEFFNGRRVPFWHMQTGFSKYIAYYLMTQRIFKKRYRIPFPMADQGDLNVAKDLLSYFYNLILAGQVTHPKLAYLKGKLQRGALYKEFFETDLPYELFTDEVWWKRGVFAPHAAT